ncbi:citrate/2-methylcitrate synthase [Cystobacter fuscus]
MRADLARLKVRHDARAGHAAVAAGALRWGEPVIDSAVSRVGAEGLAYRGHSAVRLAVEGRSLEDVAELLWTGSLPESPVRWPSPEPPLPPASVAALLPGDSPPLAVLLAVVPLLGAWDAVRFAAPAEQERLRARRLLRHRRPGWVEAMRRRGWAGRSRSGAWRTRWRWPGASRRSAHPSC